MEACLLLFINIQNLYSKSHFAFNYLVVSVKLTVIVYKLYNLYGTDVLDYVDLEFTVMKCYFISSFLSGCVFCSVIFSP